MSRITNARISPGDNLSTADLNTKFSDVGTATAALNEANLRAESVGVGNISDTAVIADVTVVKNAVIDLTTTPATIDGRSGAAVVTLEEVALGATVVATTTDLIRIYWQVVINGFVVIPATTTVDPLVEQQDSTGGVFWLTWPEVYDTVGTAWVRLPNQTADPGAGADFRMDQSPTVMPILHYEYTEAGAGSNVPNPIPPMNISDYAKASYSRGCFTIPGSDLTYDKVRIRMKGLYRCIEAGGESYFTDAAYLITKPQDIIVGSVSVAHILMRRS
jgi:hypothetical protein